MEWPIKLLKLQKKPWGKLQSTQTLLMAMFVITKNVFRPKTSKIRLYLGETAFVTE